MTFIKVHESLADGEHSARLSLKYHIIIIIKAVFSFTVAKKKKKLFIKGEDLWQLQNQRREEKEGRDLMSKSKPVSQSRTD